MENRREVKIIAIVALLVAVVGLSVAYAALSTSLTISGTAKVNAATWAVGFEEGSWALTGSASATEPELVGSELKNFVVTLTKPGDKAVYTFKVKNTGSIDAKILTTPSIGTLSCTGGADATENTRICEALRYTLTYDDGTAIAANDTLAKTNGEKTLVLTVEYTDVDFLPSAAINVSGLTASIQYGQA